MVAGLAAALTAGAAWVGFGASSAGGEQAVPAADRVESRGWQGRTVDSVAQAKQLAGAGRTLTLVSREERARGVDVGKTGDSVGDFFVFEESLYTSPRSRRVIGEDTVRCELGIRTFNCEGTFRIDGRGKITVGSALFGPRDNAVPVTGGTREFSGAGGTLQVYDLRGGRTLLVFKLVR